MVLTRQQSETVWVRLCNEILDAGPDTPLRRAFENGDSITSLIAFETSGPQVIQNLVYVNPTEPDQLRQLSPGMKNKATLFQQFLEQLRIDNGNIDLDVAQWNTVTEADFNSFLHNNRVTHNTVALIPGAPPFIAPALPQPATPPDLVREFKKSIKRDDTSYPVFKEQKNWNSWNREMTARARVHDLLDVLTPSFVPDHTVPFAVELFAQKQAFLYNAFLKTIQTDSGRALVRQFEEYHDAQAIYAGLVKFASESTAAVLERDRLIEYVTITKLGLDWRGTNVQFILHWKEQMRLLDDLLPFNEQHPANTRKRMLESAVRDVPELLAIRAMDLNRSAIPGQRPMSYAQYSDVLLSAATELDNRNKIPVKSRRSVHQTVFDPFDNDLFDHDDEAQMLTVWNANSTPMRASVPSELWHKLPVEFQQMIKDHNQTVPSTRNNPNTAKRGAKFQANHTEHTMYPIDDDPDGNLPDDTAVREPESPVDNPILSYVTQHTPIPGIGLKSVFAAAHDRRKGGSYAPVNKDKAPFPPPVPTSTQQSIVVNGVTFLSVDTHNVVYCTSKSATTPNAVASLIDRGANGGLAGSDVRVIETTQRHADVSGINDHTISGLPIVTAAGVVQSHLGPICLIMHQYAYHGKGKTIHSSIQIEQFGNDVNDRSRKFKGGTQSITTIDGYVIPLSIRSGLVCMDMHPPSDTEYDSMPHVALTSDADWDPGITNHELDVESWTDDMIEHDEVPSFNQYGDFLFDDQGYYRPATIVSQHYASLHGHHNSAARGDVFDVTTRIRNLYNSHNVTINPKSPDFALLRPFFAWAPIDTIKRTFDVTTRWARATEQVPFRKHFKSRFPALNIHRRREPVATDTIYSDTPAINNGATAAQIFVGIETLVTDVYSMKTDSDFVCTLEDNIRRRGAMDKLVSDRAQTEISNKVLDLLRHYAIDDWQSEPYHEHQNHAERRYQLVKKTVNNVLDKTGAPDFTWFLTLRYVCYILNHIAHESLSWQTPLFCLTGHTTDISILTQFTFWEPVYYATASVLKYEGKPNFPSESQKVQAVLSDLVNQLVTPSLSKSSLMTHKR